MLMTHQPFTVLLKIKEKMAILRIVSAYVRGRMIVEMNISQFNLLCTRNSYHLHKLIINIMYINLLLIILLLMQLQLSMFIIIIV